jgi:pyruvate/2-oxoglutarate dehydrogenase complex dihydrolipoamide acyltransferase (E2) component
VFYEPVDVLVTVERRLDGERILIPFVVEDADQKTLDEISTEIKAARVSSFEATAIGGRSLPAALPAPMRRVAATILGRSPRLASRLGPPIGVASVGMFGVGWGIPVSSLTLLVTIGGMTAKPVLAEERCFVNHEFLPLTLTFDHTSIDGATAGRFAEVLCGLLENGAVIDEQELDGDLVQS